MSVVSQADDEFAEHKFRLSQCRGSSSICGEKGIYRAREEGYRSVSRRVRWAADTLQSSAKYEVTSVRVFSHVWELNFLEGKFGGINHVRKYEMYRKSRENEKDSLRHFVGEHSNSLN